MKRIAFKTFRFENKKVRTADINPILHKIARFNSVNRKNKKRDKSKKEDLSRCVRVKGLEPPRREALDPKSSVSTNFTTPASNGLQI